MKSYPCESYDAVSEEWQAHLKLLNQFRSASSMNHRGFDYADADFDAFYGLTPNYDVDSVDYTRLFDFVMRTDLLLYNEVQCARESGVEINLIRHIG